MDLSHKVKTIGARLVVKMDKEEDVTNSGLILVQDVKEPKFTGVVVAVGDGQRLSNGTKFPMEVAIGDHVLYSRMAGVPTKIEGEEGDFLIINERDVLAIFPK